MSDIGYDDIRKSWDEEVSNHGLQNLSDLRLSRMVSHLSKTRLRLAGIEAKNRLQADLLTQETLNMEFMLRDLLELRKEKILAIVLAGRTPSADMTLAEEEYSNRLKRAFDGHEEFVQVSLVGGVPESGAEVPDEKEEDDGYIIARFLRAIDDQFVGLDDVVHGPFERDSVAMIPTPNAMKWLNDGLISRVVLSNESGRSGK